MKSMLQDLPRAIGQGMVECLLFFPVLYIPMVYLLPKSFMIIWSVVLILGYAAGFAGSRQFNLNTFLKSGLWACVLAIVVSISLLGTSLALLVTVPSLIVACYRGARMEQISWFIMFPGQYFLIGLIVYGVSSFVLSFIVSFKPFLSVLTLAGALALIVTLFIVNRKSVEEQTLPGSEVPVIEQRVLRYNRGMIIILLLIIGVIVLFSQLQQWLAALGRSIASWISGLLSTSPEESEPLQQNLPGENNMPFPEEISSPPAWIKFIEQLAFYAFYILAAALIVFLLYRFAKALPGLLRQMSAWLNRLMSRSPQNVAVLGYEDEEIEIEHEKASKLFKRLLKGLGVNRPFHKNDESGDNAAKIRQIYRRILTRKIREGYKWQPSRTPRETEQDLKAWKEAEESMTEGFISLYEQARYGDRSIRDDELHNNLKKFNRK
ncbi:DUF4129 domain-containing protein [Paenibacillus sp. N3/727]|uniref:DUF4129 domain-containing protein n=1 Tax=Paenibacillus sp. N3/727 TaxID=2925845 RepID=UPI001F53A525|nr:DUF4129 domain-containing protein [Paenibacillus sp. N3/727]UNK16549.1 DUF4129 domain-containing protein [Paenibacillus sp. N3/727]